MVSVGNLIIVDGWLYEVINTDNDKIRCQKEGCILTLTKGEFTGKLNRKEIIRCNE